MKKVLVVLSIMMFNSILLVSQTLDEEIGFKLVKADYLLTTERFEDAVRELNDVIKTNPAFKNAMLLRAETKFKLAAFKGAKADALEAINLNGITGRAAAVLGKADHALNNQENALNSISAAIALGEKDAKLFELRAEIYEIKGQKGNACEDWQMAAKMGSSKGSINARRVCGQQDTHSTPSTTPSTTVVTPPATESKTEVDEPITTANTPNTDTIKTNTNSGPASQSEGTESTTSASVGADSTAVVVDDPTIPKEDDTVGEVVIDDELTLNIFGMGLGKRKLMEKPNILILSEKDGTVAIEVCVNAEGRVSAAEFIGIKSTISQASLVSLAVRKAKELWFEKSIYTNQCGYIHFVIKGS
jgi:tetratricopeptide (TPR) repeat protein